MGFGEKTRKAANSVALGSYLLTSLFVNASIETGATPGTFRNLQGSFDCKGVSNGLWRKVSATEGSVRAGGSLWAVRNYRSRKAANSLALGSYLLTSLFVNASIETGRHPVRLGTW
ncbi:hypothetical protein INT47_006303 [Mucor saturninus]|uniref:Uncharacterized protein n=1 Tax=Mucor saturninus TaxID=64648 RepID=A0A8H7RGU2_9FUNG|nr:hypothetical protein INT47_006303 [Mucor saturninus]